MKPIVFKPQPGKQEMFLKHSADICIYGGAAGGGKSYALLLEPGYHIDNPGFEAVIFRQQRPQILNAGGLWDVSSTIYPNYGAKSTRSPKLMWTFPSGAKVTFAHLGMEKELQYWQGSQIPLIMFDELTHFSEKMFFYMLSRNRSLCGVKPYVRATCNPDADSWVAKFIEWWIDQETGYPIEERCGKVRWFIRRDEVVYWADAKSELWEEFNLVTEEERGEPKSVAFVSSTLQDNKLLMKQDPSYLANLKALPTVERERLLYGNWKIKAASGLYFSRKYLEEIVEYFIKDEYNGIDIDYIKIAGRGRKTKSYTDEELGEYVDYYPKGSYFFNYYQTLHKIPIMMTIIATLNNKQENKIYGDLFEYWGTTGGICQIMDRNSFWLTIKWMKIEKEHEETVRLLPIEQIINTVEKEIKAGHVRNVYALKLGYIIYLNDRSPETYTLYPMWVLDCDYVENKNKEIKVNPYSDDIRDCFSFERICINPETAEMMDFLNPKTSMLYAP